MAACAPINLTVKMAPSNRGSRSGSKTSCGNQNRNNGNGNGCGIQIQACQASGSSERPMPNYMKPLSRTPSFSARINIGGGGCCPGHPRPDCCKVPCPLPEQPRCPLGIYAERVKSLKPDRTYEPPETKFEGLSTYREHFFLKCADKAKSFKPAKTFVPSDAKMEGISTYRETYHCKPVRPREKPEWSIKGTFQPSDAKMEGITQYRFDYKGCMAPRQESYKKATTFVPSDAKLEGVTTYRVAYIPYCAREYDYAKPQQNAKPIGQPSCGKMEGVSTYKMDYYPKCGPRTNSLKPALKPRFSDAKMQGLTTYKNDFIPFHFNNCPPENCIPAELYSEMYPDPCMFSCSGGGDGDKKKAEEDCPDVCPVDPICCAGKPPGAQVNVDQSGGGFASGCCEQPYPYNAGNAGEQIRECCNSLSDPLPKKEEQDC